MSPPQYRRVLLAVFSFCFLFHLPNYANAVYLKFDHLFKDDFRHYYTGSLILRERRPILYDPQKFQEFAQQEELTPVVGPGRSAPALFAMLVPFTHLHLLDASRVWLVLNHGVLLLALYLTLRCSEVVPRPPPFVPALLCLWAVSLTFSPTIENYVQGQINFLVLVSCAMSLFLWMSGYPILAGIALSLAINAKVFPAAIALYYIYRKDYWAGISALAATCVSNLAVGLVYGWPNVWDFRTITNHLNVSSFEDQSVRYALAELFSIFGHEPRSLGWFCTQTVYLTMVATLLWSMHRLFSRKASRKQENILAEFSLVVTTQYLISAYSTATQQLGLLLVFTFYFVASWNSARPPWRGSLAVLACFLVLSTVDGYVSRIMFYAQLQYFCMRWHIPALTVLALWILQFRAYRDGHVFETRLSPRAAAER
jgi:hypothetical protein